MKLILVTGGAGFVGSALVNELLAYNYKVIVVDNLSIGRRDYLPPNSSKFRFIHANASYKVLKSIMKQVYVDTVFNLAVSPLPESLIRPSKVISNTIQITVNVCELLKREYFSKLIHFSSSEVYGSALRIPMDENHPIRPATPYAAAKASCDMIVQSYNNTFELGASIIRPFNMYGPRQNSAKYAAITPIMINRLLNGVDLYIHGTGSQFRDFTYVDDVAVAARMLLESEYENVVINVGSGIPTTIRQWVSEIREAYGINSSAIKFASKRSGDVELHVADYSRVSKLLGWKPTMSIQDGLKRTINWYKNNS